ncbi:MAG: DUF928 domain-containing protein [Alkalinema sp. RU_4_3]|nr:DUF928 domain-containing protein [Alkalinema sp. RU_4_3]
MVVSEKQFEVRPMLQRLTVSSILLGFILGTMALPPVAQAQTLQKSTKNRLYKPRKRSTPKGPTSTTATRGCDVDKFVALAPANDPGQTQSPRPTFAWYISQKEPKPLRFELLNAQQDIIHTINLTSQPGITEYKLPETAPGLTIGQAYQWRVIVQCQPGRPSSDQLVSAEIELIAPKPTRSTAQEYAEMGLWYDAFAVATEQERLQLLSDLANLEAEEPADKILQQSKAIETLITPP